MSKLAQDMAKLTETPNISEQISKLNKMANMGYDNYFANIGKQAPQVGESVVGRFRGYTQEPDKKSTAAPSWQAGSEVPEAYRTSPEVQAPTQQETGIDLSDTGFINRAKTVGGIAVDALKDFDDVMVKRPGLAIGRFIGESASQPLLSAMQQIEKNEGYRVFDTKDRAFKDSAGYSSVAEEELEKVKQAKNYDFLFRRRFENYMDAVRRGDAYVDKSLYNEGGLERLAELFAADLGMDVKSEYARALYKGMLEFELRQHGRTPEEREEAKGLPVKHDAPVNMAAFSLSQKAREKDDSVVAGMEASKGNPYKEDTFEYHAHNVLHSALPFAAGVATTIIAKNPTLGAAVMVTPAAAPAYTEAREHGLTPDESFGYTLLTLAAEFVPDKFVLGQLTKRMGAGKSLLGTLLFSTALEGADETITEALNIALETGILDKDMTWGQMQRRLKDSFIAGAVLGGAGGVAFHAADKYFDPTGNNDRVQRDQIDSEIAALVRLGEQELNNQQGASPSPSPAPTPSASPSPSPSASPSPSPAPSQTPAPSSTPAPTPTPSASPSPTPTPSASPAPTQQQPFSQDDIDFISQNISAADANKITGLQNILSQTGVDQYIVDAANTQIQQMLLRYNNIPTRQGGTLNSTGPSVQNTQPLTVQETTRVRNHLRKRMGKLADRINITDTLPDGTKLNHEGVMLPDGTVYVNPAAIREYSVNGKTIMDRDQRIEFVAWHEMRHAAEQNLSQRPFGAAKLDALLSDARRNKVVDHLAKAIMAERAAAAQQTGNTSILVNERIATQEALAELSAAIRTGNHEALTARYRDFYQINSAKGAHKIIKDVGDAIRRIVGKITGKKITEDVLSNEDAIKMMLDVENQFYGPIQSAPSAGVPQSVQNTVSRAPQTLAPAGGPVFSTTPENLTQGSALYSTRPNTVWWDILNSDSPAPGNPSFSDVQEMLQVVWHPYATNKQVENFLTINAGKEDWLRSLATTVKPGFNKLNQYLAEGGIITPEEARLDKPLVGSHYITLKNFKWATTRLSGIIPSISIAVQPNGPNTHIDFVEIRLFLNRDRFDEYGTVAFDFYTPVIMDGVEDSEQLNSKLRNGENFTPEDIKKINDSMVRLREHPVYKLINKISNKLYPDIRDTFYSEREVYNGLYGTLMQNLNSLSSDILDEIIIPMVPFTEEYSSPITAEQVMRAFNNYLNTDTLGAAFESAVKDLGLPVDQVEEIFRKAKYNAINKRSDYGEYKSDTVLDFRKDVAAVMAPEHMVREVKQFFDEAGIKVYGYGSERSYSDTYDAVINEKGDHILYSTAPHQNTVEKVGQLINSVTLREENDLDLVRPGEIDLWHGSAFDGLEDTGFDFSKIGSGAGGQNYGWGIYLSDTQGFAQGYPITTTNIIRFGDSNDIFQWNRVLNKYFRQSDNAPIESVITDQGAIDAVNELARQIQKRSADPLIAARMVLQANGKPYDALNSVEFQRKDHLYNVKLDGDLTLLDFSAKLSEQPKVWEAIQKIKESYPTSKVLSKITQNTTGKKAYSLLSTYGTELYDSPVTGTTHEEQFRIVHSGSRWASEQLMNNGVSGNRFRSGSNVNNYVVWDTQALAGADTTRLYSTAPKWETSDLSEVQRKLMVELESFKELFNQYGSLESDTLDYIVQTPDMDDKKRIKSFIYELMFQRIFNTINTTNADNGAIKDFISDVVGRLDATDIVIGSSTNQEDTVYDTLYSLGSTLSDDIYDAHFNIRKRMSSSKSATHKGPKKKGFSRTEDLVIKHSMIDDTLERVRGLGHLRSVSFKVARVEDYQHDNFGSISFYIDPKSPVLSDSQNINFHIFDAETDGDRARDKVPFSLDGHYESFRDLRSAFSRYNVTEPDVGGVLGYINFEDFYNYGIDEFREVEGVNNKYLDKNEEKIVNSIVDALNSDGHRTKNIVDILLKDHPKLFKRKSSAEEFAKYVMAYLGNSVEYSGYGEIRAAKDISISDFAFININEEVSDENMEFLKSFNIPVYNEGLTEREAVEKYKAETGNNILYSTAPSNRRELTANDTKSRKKEWDKKLQGTKKDLEYYWGTDVTDKEIEEFIEKNSKKKSFLRKLAMEVNPGFNNLNRHLVARGIVTAEEADMVMPLFGSHTLTTESLEYLDKTLGGKVPSMSIALRRPDTNALLGGFGSTVLVIPRTLIPETIIPFDFWSPSFSTIANSPLAENSNVEELHNFMTDRLNDDVYTELYELGQLIYPDVRKAVYGSREELDSAFSLINSGFFEELGGQVTMPGVVVDPYFEEEFGIKAIPAVDVVRAFNTYLKTGEVNPADFKNQYTTQQLEVFFKDTVELIKGTTPPYAEAKSLSIIDLHSIPAALVSRQNLDEVKPILDKYNIESFVYDPRPTASSQQVTVQEAQQQLINKYKDVVLYSHAPSWNLQDVPTTRPGLARRLMNYVRSPEFADKWADRQGELERIMRLDPTAAPVRHSFKGYNSRVQHQLERDIEPRFHALSDALVGYFEQVRGLPVYSSLKKSQAQQVFLEHLDKIGKYIYHGRERNIEIAVRTNGEDFAGSGRSEVEIIEVENFFNAPERGSGQLLQIYEEIYNNHLKPLMDYSDQILRDNGLLTPEMEAARPSYQWYVPLYGKPELEDPSTDQNIIDSYVSRGGGTQRDVLQNRLHSAGGRHGTEAHSIFETVFTQAEIAVRRAQMQEAKRELWDYLQTPRGQQLFDAQIHTVGGASTQSSSVNQQGQLTWQTALNPGANDIVYQDGNELHVMSIGNPRALSAVKDFNKAVITNNVEKSFNWITRFMGSMYTRFNPSFIVKNKFMDSLQQWQLLLADAPTGTQFDTSGLVGYGAAAANVASRIPLVMKAMAYNFAWTSTAGATPDYKQWLERYASLGGVTTYAKFLGHDQLRNLQQEFYEKSQGVVRFVNPKNQLTALGKLADGLNNYLELTTRVSAFRALVESGVDEVTAANYVKDIMNFETKGEFAIHANSIYPFFTSSLYDIRRIGKALSRKEGQVVFLALVGLSYAMWEMLAQAGGDDEDGVPWVDKYPMGIAARHFIMPIASDDGAQRGEGVRLPIGYGLGRLANSLALSMRRLANGTDDAGNFVSNIVNHSLIGSFSPLQPSDVSITNDTSMWLFNTFAPQAIKPIIQFGANKNWRGTPIYDTGIFRSDGDLDYNSGFPFTPDTYKIISEKIYDVTGGDIAPESLQFWVQTAIGGLGTDVVSMAEMIIDQQGLGNQTTASWYKSFPVLGGFIQTSPSEDRERYYIYRDRVNDQFNRLVDAAKRGKDTEAYRQAALWNQQFEAMDKQLSKIRKSRKQAREMLKGEQLREAERKLNTVEKTLQNNIIRQYEEQTGERK